MAYSSHISSKAISTSGGRGGGPSSKAPTMYGRVVDVILSLDDPRCTDASKVNGVYYRKLKIATNEEDIDRLEFAPQGNATNRQIPLVGEVVSLVTLPGSDTLQQPEKTQLYWKDIVNVWNHPHHNALPDTKQLEWQSNLLGGVPEKKDINPLQANPGDYLIEGRLGQSIRIGGYKGKNIDFIDDSNDGDPILVLSNGQIKTTNGSDLIYEDINKDYNSIYFLSNHKVNLVAANTKRDSYNTIPLAADKYRGNQIVMNAGRIYLNAKEESILLTGKESVGLNAKTINIDSIDYFCVDGKRIYLGRGARVAQPKFEQPAVLGKQLEIWLGSLLSTLDLVANAMSTASAVGAGPVMSLNVTGPSLKATVKALKQQYKLFQSKKVFIE